MILFIFMFVVALLVTAAMVKWSAISGLLDIPNHRSSHVQPTPRGGGIAIVLVFVLTVLLGIYTEQLYGPIWLLFLVAVVLVALIGFVDDFRDIGVLSRLLVQFSACTLCVGTLVFFDWFNFSQYGLFLYALLAFVLVIAGVWLINLYNFMDGIDGIAGLQAFVMSSVMIVIFYLAEDYGLMQLAAGLAAGSLGFLCWNLPKAKIFMGDSGSGGLGIIFFIFILCSGHENLQFIFVWLILLAVFIVDASFTLLVRLLTGQRIFSAHNLHAYQKLTRKHGSHVYISISITLFNLIWVAPLAFLTYHQVISDIAGIALAYLPVLVICIKLKAGVIEQVSEIK